MIIRRPRRLETQTEYLESRKTLLTLFLVDYMDARCEAISQPLISIAMATDLETQRQESEEAVDKRYGAYHLNTSWIRLL